MSFGYSGSIGLHMGYSPGDIGFHMGYGGSKANGSGVSGAPYTIPLIFTNSTFPANLIDYGNGTFGTDYNAVNFRDVGTTYYVATTGNDTTGDGTSGNPWRTIQQAINTVASGSQISIAPGRYPNFTLSAKNVSLIASGAGVYVGDLLTNADVSSWGSPTSGRQAVTLTTGAVSGFVDLTLNKASFPQVSKVQSTAGAIATAQAAGDPGVFRSTPSTIGASDGRDLTSKFDTELVAWRDTAAAAFVLSSAAKLYAYGITFVTGAESSIPKGCKLIGDNCQMLGGTGQILSTGVGGSGSCYALLYQTKVRGCAVGGNDAIDYTAGSNTLGFEYGCYMDQAGPSSADDVSTAHGNPTLRINGTYRDASKALADVGDGISGVFGCALNAYTSNLCVSGQGSTDMHVKGCTFSGTPTQDLEIKTGGRLFFYDKGYVGKTVGGGGSVTDRSGNKPVGQQKLLSIDLSQTSTVLKAGGTPVSADGDLIDKIICAAGTGGYIQLAAGTATYHTSGGKAWMTLASARFTMNAAGSFKEDTSVIFGWKSSDTTFILFGLATQFVDFRSSGDPYASSKVLPIYANGGFTVDGSSTILTTASAVKTAACNGSNHVFTMRKVALGFGPFSTSSTSLFSTTTGTNNFDGDVYAVSFVWNGSDAEIHAEEQRIGTLMGLTIA